MPGTASSSRLAKAEAHSKHGEATKLEKLIKEGAPGTSVSVNPDKPRKGCFEVRGPGGKTFVSLLDMPRPFTKLKALDVEALAEEVLAALKE
ncbi:hypothetical protein CHLRE_02g120301v5 [Chlamydomonas reinhardtii]|uniref:Selenoprotein H n=1 Tax=Chlamydomonas reinhardtii TaxID=3055 RepID=A0A2K3E3M3_CHLRE|nr:uncharacterized protein CHLRE_02g120301v5 [Chlamydomonas reinhardtii]PNW87376.1 hypothetical protein CHLRE_02g120301v5 [Chlamydomonas reinhardtii]